MDFGISLKEFKEQELLNWFVKVKEQETTEGIFALGYLQRGLQKIGGHDSLFIQSKRIDIFNRFILGYNVFKRERLCLSYDLSWFKI